MDNFDRFLDLVLAGLYVLLIAVGLFCLACARLEDPSAFWEDVLFLVLGATLVGMPLVIHMLDRPKPE